MNEQLRIGVIGTGLMGEIHARNVYGHTAKARLVAIADFDLARAQALADELGGARAYQDGMALLNDADVDAVIVASPDHTHAGYALAAVHAGKPVLCEKPLASEAADAYAIVRAEHEVGRRLVQVGFMREFDPAHIAVREAVGSGVLGRPVMFKGTHINKAPAGPTTAKRCITQSMIHDLHSARFLMGQEIVETYARWVPMWGGDESMARAVTVTVTFANGATGLIDVGVEAVYGYEVSAEVLCEFGKASTELPARAAIRSAGHLATDITPGWQDRFPEAYVIELNAWLESLRTGVPVGPGAWDGYAANAVAEAACRSVDSGRPEPVIMESRL